MKSKQQQNKNAGLYYRLSKDDERAGESLSIENQKLMLRKFAAEQGFTVIDEYIDDGWSGTSFNRPEVKRLLEDAKTGRINVIIVKDLSRFGRNYIEVGQYTDYIFPMHNIRFIALGDNVDSANTENAGMDMMPIMNVFNEWHAASTSKKIRAVIETNAKSGKYRANAAPYGYVKGNDENRLPVRDEPAASYVLRMFEMRAKGISPNKIADALNEEGIKTPADYKEEKFGIPNTRKSHHLWSCATVKQILTNPTYLGHLVQMRTTTLSYKNKKTVKRDPEDMVWVYNTHEAIVSQELWDKCREMEASVSQGKKNRTGVVLPLSGLAYCADCGAKMHSGWNNTRHKRTDPRTYHRNHFNCGSYTKFQGRSCCSHYIKMATLEQIVLEDIRSKIQLVETDEAEARATFLKRCDLVSSEEAMWDRKRTSQILRRTAELDKLISSVYEDKVSGKIPEDICVGLLEKYQAEKLKLQNERSEIEKRQADTTKERANVDEFISRLKTYLTVPTLTREMCMELIEFVTVDKCPGKYSKEPREIHIYYKLIDKTPPPEKKYLSTPTCEDI